VNEPLDAVPTPAADPHALWLSQLAHDLRNQLAPMRTATQMLQLGRLEADRQREMLDMLERQIQRIVQMLDDLSEYGRLRAGQPGSTRERIDLGVLVDSALGECGRRIAAAGQQLADVPSEQRLPVVVERQRVVQCLIRLLDNASRFTPKGGRVEVEVDRDGAMARVRVRDSGQGIEPERLQSIFDIPVKGRSSSGLGISLMLARACATAHDGTLEARSAGPGLGSEFELRLPLAE
jgi:signal transduction histidine kinase